MRKKATVAIAVAAILCLVTVAVLLFTDPSRKPGTLDQSSSPASFASDSTLSSESSVESSLLPESLAASSESSQENSQQSSRPEISAQEGVSQTPLPEDSPGKPDVNYETPSSSFDDINLKVLSDLLSENLSDLSGYVSSEGLTLCPTGAPNSRDLTYSADEVADFLSMPINTFGAYPGSGYGITMSPAEYYNKYIIPSDFDFTLATTQYDDPTDLSIASDFGNVHTVTYSYAPGPMEWKKIIFVYSAGSDADALRAVIYQDATTD